MRDGFRWRMSSGWVFLMCLNRRIVDGTVCQYRACGTIGGVYGGYTRLLEGCARAAIHDQGLLAMR